MARRVFLHVGTPKSGTTHLQERFALNRDLIARQGLTYPSTRAGDHFEAALDLIDEPWPGEREQARGQWVSLVGEVRRTSGDILISHELLAAATPAQIARVMTTFGGDEVHVILTARDLACQIPAEWQEQLKYRGRRSFKDYMSEIVEGRRINPELWFWRVQSIPDVLTRWSNGLSPERVHVVTVPPKGGPPDELWRRFASVVGIDPDAEYAESPAANTSLGVVEASVLRRLNRLLAGKGVSREVYVDLVREVVGRETLGKRRDVVPIVVPEARWPFVGLVTQEWLDWLTGAGVDVVGDLDDLRPEPPGPEHVWVHPDRAPADQVAQASLESLAAVIRAVAPTHQSPVRRLARRLLRG
ncbi:MAG: hypothetical protein ACHQNA_13520 [Acidimicrobiales bacterium]